MTRRKVLCRDMPEPRLEAFPGVEFLRVMFPEMERLLHCNQGFIAHLGIDSQFQVAVWLLAVLGSGIALATCQAEEARIFPSRPLLADKP
jgi:hypothetical protein